MKKDVRLFGLILGVLWCKDKCIYSFFHATQCKHEGYD